ncbi:hypothetical protein L1049_011232 [Liquidambar formosana]|uniref:N-alpha-acetyltransferase 60 n=1 Tax=Liquidambar formosana TaxID=63359 RepID=A0AAP0RRD4_LIQFO
MKSPQTWKKNLEIPSYIFCNTQSSSICIRLLYTHSNKLRGVFDLPSSLPFTTESPDMSKFCWGLRPQSSMVDLKASHRPSINFRPIRPSDLEVLEQIHADIFPIRYESDFFQNVVNGRDIVSWAAVDQSRPNEQSDELIGFVTARIVLAKESEISDLLGSSKSDQTLVYILTLGVVKTYRNRGIATSLVREVIRYASSIQTCRAVYLHVISYNNPAILLYKKMSFKYVRRLYGFYLINGEPYDAYLFVYYVNGGRSPCSPLELVTVMLTCVQSAFKSVASRLRKNEEKKVPKWPKCKETCCLVTTTQNKRIVINEGTGCECV